jgi:ABC-type uncharacterized transport system ATPase subunit
LAAEVHLATMITANFQYDGRIHPGAQGDNEHLDRTFDLSKRFPGAVTPDDLVPEGSVFGLVGPNGAGKTTTVQNPHEYPPADDGTR